MVAGRLTPGLRYRNGRVLAISLVVSVLLHGGGLYAAHRWGACVCDFGKVVCPKVCAEPGPLLDIELSEPKAPPPPPLIKPKPETQPKPLIVAEQMSEEAPAAPKRGSVVLPDEALEVSAAPLTGITLDRPQLPMEAVTRESEAEARVIVTGEIFGRVHELSPGSAGIFGLGGTGTATGIGPFGVEEEGGGEGATASAPAPVAPLAPEPPTKPKGPTRPPRVLDWTDPPYPEQARQQGVEGTVLLRLIVSADGRPRDVSIARSSGHVALDEAALAHVRRAKLSPALRDGDPIAMTISFRVKFSLVSA